MELSGSLIINGGLRFDYGTNDTEYYRQFVWDSNENITDSLVAPLTDSEFFNWSASLGGNFHVSDAHWIIKANLGKSFRVPYPAETVSNGIHHGTFRHEMGTPDLKSEHGYQLDASSEWEFDRFSANLALYFNFFDNYIYLGPTFPARFSPLPEAGQIFQYRQDDAIYTGFEMQWDWQLTPSLKLGQVADFVQSYNLNTGLALPFTPQPSIKSQIRYQGVGAGILEKWHAGISHQFCFAAEGNLRVDRSEQATPAYQLCHLAAGLDLNLSGQKILLNVQVQNIFDMYYLNHLSRYRLINVPEQGRNVVIALKVPFEGRISR